MNATVESEQKLKEEAVAFLGQPKRKADIARTRTMPASDCLELLAITSAVDADGWDLAVSHFGASKCRRISATEIQTIEKMPNPRNIRSASLS